MIEMTYIFIPYLLCDLFNGQCRLFQQLLCVLHAYFNDIFAGMIFHGISLKSKNNNFYDNEILFQNQKPSLLQHSPGCSTPIRTVMLFPCFLYCRYEAVEYMPSINTVKDES